MVLFSHGSCIMTRMFVLLIAVFSVILFSGDAFAKKIQVKIYVDEEEPATRAVWEKRLGDRVRRASEIIKPLCDIEFVVHSYNTWKSDNTQTEFSKSLTDFQKKAPPAPASISIGFSSQYRFTRGRHHLGGIRGPLNPWILIRESNPKITEAERLEVLVHELGHYLGAAHSPLKNSVMRPVVGDGQARAKKYVISFDKENGEVVRLVGREIRDLDIKHYVQLTPETRRRIRTQYQRLAIQLPKDPVAPLFIKVIDALEKRQRQTPGKTSPPGPIMPSFPADKGPVPGPIIPPPPKKKYPPIIPGPYFPKPES